MFLGGTVYETNYSSMSLSTVKHDDMKPSKPAIAQRESGNLLTGDIDGA